MIAHSGLPAPSWCFSQADARRCPTLRFISERYEVQAARFESARGPLSAARSAAIVAELKRKARRPRHPRQAHRARAGDRRQPARASATRSRCCRTARPPTRPCSPPSRAAQRPHQRRVLHHRGRRGRRQVRRSAARAAGARRAGQPDLRQRRRASARPRPFSTASGTAASRCSSSIPINPLAARKAWQLNNRDHRKLLIVDGRIAFLGGINISSVYSTGSFGRGSDGPVDPTSGWRDTDVQIDGPVVAEFQKLFLRTWEKQRGDAAGAEGLLSRDRAAGQRDRARDRQHARRSVQPHLPDADFGDHQRGEAGLPHQCLLRARSAVAQGADRRRGARRRRAARCCRASRIRPSCSMPDARYYAELLRRRREDLRARGRAAACQDRGHRRRLVHASARPTSTGAASWTTTRSTR